MRHLRAFAPPEQAPPPQQQRRAPGEDLRRAQAPMAERAQPFVAPRSAPPVVPQGAVLTGGCWCGAVRYALSARPDVVHCHCRTCRRLSGAAFSTWASVPASAFRLLSGTPTRLRTSHRATRGGCARCGGLLTMLYDGDSDVSVTLGSLDDPDGLRARASIWVSDRLCWTQAADRGLPHAPGDGRA
jgi:hypothetical protein